jgi:MFS transporter, NNP family, nitrate/nitrite transporter
MASEANQSAPRIKNKAVRIDLFNFSTPYMRAFHMSWFAFFICFFAWFGIGPLMAVVRDELGLTKRQIGNTVIASAAVTVFARLFVGWLCDRIGPRLAYTWLLVLGSIPVMGIGLAQNYESFLMFRLGAGVIGASFVITQYHTSVMFASNCVGTANATSAGWGNLGGGVTQIAMPLIFTAFIGIGFSPFWSWRFSMVAAGVVCLITALAYYHLTTDLPDGNFRELRARGEHPPADKAKGSFAAAAKDRRVWALFLIYAACFGIELTLNNIVAVYYMDEFGLGLKTAGLVVGLFGLMNIFARTTGGIIGDRFGERWGLKGRVRWLFVALVLEAIALMVFSRMTVLPAAIGVTVFFSLFVQMAEGATFSVVPFINKRSLGSVSGIVGAGGNAGAVAAGFLLRIEGLSWPNAMLILGVVVLLVSFATFLITFSPEEETAAGRELRQALAERRALVDVKLPRFRIPAFFRAISNAGPMAFLRIYVGVALAIKGAYFVVNFGSLEAITPDFGPWTTLAVWYVVFAHCVGGLSLAIGLGTRAAAALNIPVLFGAVFFVHRGGGIFGSDQGLQLSLLVLMILGLFVWKGASRFSMDHVMRS